MLHNYFAILIFVIFGIALSFVIPIASKIVSYITRVNKPSVEKNSPYECGFEPFGDTRTKFDVKYYLVAILFIVFDLEVAFLFPWSVVARHLSAYGFYAMGVFLLLLIVGFIYEWKKGALEWE